MEDNDPIIKSIIIALTVVTLTPIAQDHPLAMSLFILAITLMLYKKMYGD